jgi:hypothetical protein
MAANGYKYGEGRPKTCWSHAPTLGRVRIGLNVIHGPLGQNKVSQHPGQEEVRVTKRRLQPTQKDMDMSPDPFESRLDRLSMKYLNAQNGVRMKSQRSSQVVAVLQPETSPHDLSPLLILPIIPKQNKSTRVSIV